MAERLDIKEFIAKLEGPENPKLRCIRCGHDFIKGESLIISTHLSSHLRPGSFIVREVCMRCRAAMTN